MGTLNINYSYVNAGEAPGSEFDSERSDYGDGEAEDIEEVEEEYAGHMEEYFIPASEEMEEVADPEDSEGDDTFLIHFTPTFYFMFLRRNSYRRGVVQGKEHIHLVLDQPV